MSTKLLRAALLGTTALLMLQSTGAVARVGVTSATDGDPKGKPPQEAERVLRIGIDVQANEVVTTGAKDRAHLVFLDGTSVTVGPNARLVIDKFVYDPATKTGELSLTAGQGVFRLVGGRISKTKPITVNTPSSTIGIRGGITIFTVTAVTTTSTFVFGDQMTVTGQGQTQTATRPGSQVTTNQGSSPGVPTLVPPGGLSNSMSQLEGGGNQGGGGNAPNTQGNPENGAQNFANNNSAGGPSQGPPPPNPNPGPPTNTQQPDAKPRETTTQETPTVIVTRGRYLKDPINTSFDNNTLAAPRHPTNNVALQSSGSVLNGQATITTADGRSLILPWNPGNSFTFVGTGDSGIADGVGVVGKNGEYFAYVLTNRSDNKKFGVFGGDPTTTSQFPVAGFASYTLYNLSESGGIPFAHETIANNSDLKAAATVSKLYSVYSANLAPGAGPTNQGAQSFQVTIAISGTGANQKSYMGGFIGDYYKDFNNNTYFNSGNYTGSYRLTASAQIGRLVSSISTGDTGTGNAIYGPNADAMVFMNDQLRTTVTGNTATTTRTPALALNQPYTNLTGSDYFTLNAALKDLNTSLGTGARTTQTMNGYAGGLIEGRDANGTFTTRMPDVLSMKPTDVSISTDATLNRAQGTIVINRMTDDANPAGSTTPKRTIELGSTTGPRFSNSAFIDDKIYGMRDQQDDVTRFSKVTINGTDTQINSRTVLTSYNAAPVAQFWTDQGVTPCECAFLSWGWWSGDIRYDNAAYRLNERDRLHLYTYVVGTLWDAQNLPQTGNASYAGHMLGNVNNNGNYYTGAGTFQLGWNFGTRSGTFSGTFDGGGFSGNASAVANTHGRDYSASISSTSGPTRSGSVMGSFFTGGADPVKGTAGAFNLSGTNYQATGTFAGQKQ